MAGAFFLYPFQKDDIVTLKKPHPCGGTSWKILRIGLDATLVCEKCGRTMIIDRRALEKACVRVVGGADTKDKM